MQVHGALAYKVRQMRGTRHTSMIKMSPERALGLFHTHIILSKQECQNAWQRAKTAAKG
jgi:hypothetical protein